jgi:hypothetical protein
VAQVVEDDLDLARGGFATGDVGRGNEGDCVSFVATGGRTNPLVGRGITALRRVAS